MRIVMTTDSSLFVCNGKYYYATQVATIVKRYYKCFGKLSVCARTTRIDVVTNSHEEVTHMLDRIVEIQSLPKALLGLYDEKIKQLVEQCDLLICRCPGVISHRAAAMARKYKK